MRISFVLTINIRCEFEKKRYIQYLKISYIKIKIGKIQKQIQRGLQTNWCPKTVKLSFIYSSDEYLKLRKRFEVGHQSYCRIDLRNFFVVLLPENVV